MARRLSKVHVTVPKLLKTLAFAVIILNIIISP